MTVLRRRILAGATTGMLTTAAKRAGAVIILDGTWRLEGGAPGQEGAGFRAHMALANQPQFAAVIPLSDDEGQNWGAASGTWIGNVAGRGFVLTAAHVFHPDGAADDYVYRTPGGSLRQGTEVVFHPFYNWKDSERTGYDLAIVRLDGAVDDAGPPPALYAGDREDGARIVIVGYGTRGIGSTGERPEFNTLPGKAAAENTVDEVMAAVLPPPAAADAGNWLGVTLRREDEGAGWLDGILGSGDSGGSAWLRAGGEWAIAGVNANGTGDTYGAQSYFARVSGVREWLESIVPGLRFVT